MSFGLCCHIIVHVTTGLVASCRQKKKNNLCVAWLITHIALSPLQSSLALFTTHYPPTTLATLSNTSMALPRHLKNGLTPLEIEFLAENELIEIAASIDSKQNLELLGVGGGRLSFFMRGGHTATICIEWRLQWDVTLAHLVHRNLNSNRLCFICISS